MATGWLPVLAMLAVLSSGPGGQGVDGQLTEPGICPFSSPLSEWSEEQFVSRPWYEVKAFAVPGLHDSVTGPSCTRWHLTPSEDGMGLHARLAYRAGDDDGVVHGFAQYTSKEKYPRFNFTLRDLGGSGLTRSVDMKLVATDYDNFALLWGCSEPNLFERKVVSWVLSRDPVLSEGAEETLRTLFRRHDIRAEKFVHTDHQSCGAAAGAAYFTDVTTFPNLMEESQQDSVFASFRNADADTLENQRLEDRMLNSADSVNSQPLDGDLVSWSYIGADSGSYLSPQVMLVAVVLAFAAVSLIASLLTFRAVLQRRAATKPVLPVRRQDIVVATLGSGVDYSRFGGLGQGLVQTRKHGGDSSLSRPRP